LQYKVAFISLLINQHVGTLITEVNVREVLHFGSPETLFFYLLRVERGNKRVVEFQPNIGRSPDVGYVVTELGYTDVHHDSD
jgi:hypothetical protein